MTTPMRRCKECKREFPATTEFFHSRVKGKYLASYCKPCACIRAKEWADSNPERVKSRSKTYYQQNREAISAKAKKWSRDNPDRRRKIKNKWVKNNPDKILAKNARLRSKNPDKYRMYTLNRLARLESLPYEDVDVDMLLKAFNRSCAYCGIALTKFQVDHYIPLASDHCLGTVYANLVPACQPCNASKCDHDPVLWIRDRFGEYKGQVILDRILSYFDSLK